MENRANTPDLSPPLPLPFVLKQRFQVSHAIGVGSIASLFLAIDLSTNRNAVVKLYRPGLASDIAKGMHNSEVEALRLLKNPHIPELLDYGEIAGTLYVVMEFLEGRSLSHLRGSIVGSKLLREANLQLLECIGYMHSKGVIHADIKPSQIVLDDLFRLVDFGSCIRIGDPRAPKSVPNFLAGTPGYLAPEAMKFNFGPFTDIFSVGCVLAYLITGNPRSRGRLEYLSRGFRDWLPIINKATAQIDNRYRTAVEFKQDIQNIHRLRVPCLGRGEELFELTDDVVTIGRAGDIRIQDIMVSRVHAKITRNESGRFTLENLGTNGTYVFVGDSYKEIELYDIYDLNDGDVISILPPHSRIQNYLFTFRER
jgi:serine/threonine protein kinase